MKEQQQCVRQSHVASPVAKAKQESQHSHDKQRGHEVIEKPTRKPSDAIRIVGGLPDGGKRAVLYNRRRTAQTMLVILGGWSFLILSCLAFKLFALRYDWRAPDWLAEYMHSSPTAAAQWFTFCGVLLGEIALVLWGHAVSYMAFRRLAYGKERTELLTYAAWNEMSRAGYTLSRRKPLWPVCTMVVFIGNTFLPAGFTTLLLPKSMLAAKTYKGLELDQLSPGFASAIGFLPAHTFPNPANLSCGSQYVSNFWTFASHPGNIFDPCPSLDDVQTLIMAGRAKLEASANQSDPLFKLPGSITYVGGTEGTATLGPMGILPWGNWQKPPPRTPRPHGYNYTYVLEQQGLTVDVRCWQPRNMAEQSMLVIRSTKVPHLVEASLRCSNRFSTTQQGQPAPSSPKRDTSYHYVGSSSIVLMGCTGKDAQGHNDADTTTMYFKDAGVSVYGNQGSELGGDLICELKPKWTRNLVRYVSDRRWLEVTRLPDNGPPERLTGRSGELGPGLSMFDPTSEGSKEAYFPYYARLLTVQDPLAAVANAFVYTGSLSATINTTDAASASRRTNTDPSSATYTSGESLLAQKQQFSLTSNRNATHSNEDTLVKLSTPATRIDDVGDLRGTVLFGKNSAIQSLAAFNARVNTRRVKTWIQPEQVETFIQGVFEYAATSQREWFQHYAIDGGAWNGVLSEANSTMYASGTWYAQTMGWGSNSDSSTAFVLLSLIPLLCFALTSWIMVAWSHWYDAPRGTHYAADIDPTDWLEAVVAAAQGGLTDTFAEDALEREGGLLQARKVRVRLGQIVSDDFPEQRARLGFVAVD